MCLWTSYEEIDDCDIYSACLTNSATKVYEERGEESLVSWELKFCCVFADSCLNYCWPIFFLFKLVKIDIIENHFHSYILNEIM